MKKRYILQFVFLLALSGCGGGGGGGTGTGVLTPAPGDPRTDGISAEMVAAINTARASQRICGSTTMPAVSQVSWSDKLVVAAFRHSVDMAAHSSLSHTGSDGSTLGTRITGAGYSWNSCGENIAVGQSTVASVVAAWMASEGHCKNIMNADFTEIGAAYETGTYGGNPSARYWTLDLAAPR